MKKGDWPENGRSFFYRHQQHDVHFHKISNKAFKLFFSFEENSTFVFIQDIDSLFHE